ncbi:T3SS effector OspC family protein [Shigella flexneri]|uniref:T3SS effector OspC family protein n=3 Tax=Shigella flexneri TaxID=623 RepID=UPI000DA5C5A1|nr:T3SS effector OspC family protein [Shigella flexneri]SRK58250.1 OspC1 [Shigella flexneri]SRK66629.1 OspC1 [Shigella flexneri]SRN08508.1 OspC1 [Shigella flexneri]SRP92095.1 OspC1 [Shigella flexneri]SRQ55268.1 OspC1 [Shigella flexneri]
MKIPEAVNHINVQNNIDLVDGKTNPNKATKALQKNVLRVTNSSSSGISEKHLDHCANTVKNFLRKSIAAQSYSKMFSQGTSFKSLNLSLEAPSGARSSFRSLEHLDKVSRHYISEIIQKVHPLSSDERHLLSIIINSNFNFRHQSNSNLSNNILNIKSFDKIQSENIQTHKNTYSEDIKEISNHDFVFFGVEISNHQEKLPLNKTHHTVDFGANAYIIDHDSPYGYMTLTDHFDNAIPPVFYHEHQSFLDKFSEVNKEVSRYVHGSKGIIDVPIFNTKDMKLGLGLYLIDFIRKSEDQSFKEFCYGKNLAPVDLDRIINFVFQPEYHIPRMVSTENFKKVKIREISLEEAVTASNYEEINKQVTNKKIALQALFLSITNQKEDVALYILSNFEITRQDVISIKHELYDIEYLLSAHNSSCKVLEYFINKGLVDVNTKFKKTNSGDCMLDNAIKYENAEMIKLLLKYGATSDNKYI